MHTPKKQGSLALPKGILLTSTMKQVYYLCDTTTAVPESFFSKNTLIVRMAFNGCEITSPSTSRSGYKT